LDKLDAAQSSETGQLLRRVLDLRAALKLGFRIGLDEIRADEFAALMVVEDEQQQLEAEQAHDSHGPHADH